MKLHIWLLIVIQICSGFADYTENPKSADGLCALYNNHATIKLGKKDQSAVSLLATTGAFYIPRGNCIIEIVPTKGYGVVSVVEDMNLRTGFLNRCKDYVEIKGTNKSNAFCFASSSGGARFSSPETGTLFIGIHTEQDTKTISKEHNFRITLTQYRDCKYMDESKPEPGELGCSNGLCVWKDLQCDNQDNCGDESDEPSFTCFIHSLYLVFYIGGGLAGLFLICFIYVCYKKRNDPISSAPSTNYGSSEGRVVRRGFGYEEVIN